MAPISCRDLSAQLSSLPHRGTAATTTHAQISFRRAQSPRGPLSSSKRSQLPSAATRDDAVASLVGQLEHNVTTEEEDDLYLPDDAPSVRCRGAQKQEGELAARWREIHGRDDWAGLLDPMDPLLRSELIRYGELAQACYDAFDYDLSSRYCGSCKYPRRAFFDRLGMPEAARGYAVTRYLYATSNFRFPNFFSQQKKSRADAKLWSQRANWIGYVAVSTDEESARLGRRDVAIAWRGTITRLEWVSDLMDYLRPVADEGIPCPDPEVKVESGFVDLYTDKDPSCRFCKYSAREQVLLEVRKLVGHYAALGEEVSISVTGHSLGSSLAILRVRRQPSLRVRRRQGTGTGVRVLLLRAEGGEPSVQGAVRGGARGEGAAGGERARQRHADAGDLPQRGGAGDGAAGGGGAADALVLQPRRRRARPRPQALALPQGHARPRVLPQPRGPPAPARRVPWEWGAVRARKRAGPGAGEQGVRLPQGPPLRAALLAPGREQGHGPCPRRPLDPARPPGPPRRRPPPRRRRPPWPLPSLPLDVRGDEQRAQKRTVLM